MKTYIVRVYLTETVSSDTKFVTLAEAEQNYSREDSGITVELIELEYFGKTKYSTLYSTRTLRLKDRTGERSEYCVAA